MPLRKKQGICLSLGSFIDARKTQLRAITLRLWAESRETVIFPQPETVATCARSSTVSSSLAFLLFFSSRAIDTPYDRSIPNKNYRRARSKDARKLLGERGPRL